MDVSIIIVSYNTCKLTLNSIGSVLTNTKNANYEIILVDNASTDNTCELIAAKYPQVIILKNNKNIGFGAACNLGANISKGEFLFFLNSDAILLNDAIAQFLYYFKNQTNVGVVGSFLLDKNGFITHSFGGFPYPYRYLFQRFWKVFRKAIPIKNFRKLKNEVPTLSEVLDVDYVTGADMFMKTSLFKNFGGFDELYFMYSEEVDLQWRMKLSNYKRQIIPGPLIFHEEGQSSKIANYKRIQIASSISIFFSKNFGLRTGKLFAIFFISTIIIELFTDLLYKEYTINENLTFLYANLKSVLDKSKK